MAYKHNKKWRLLNPELRNRGKKRYYAQSQGGIESHQRWILMDTNLILFSVSPDKILANLIGRSVEAIQIKRCRLKKGEPNEK